MYGHVNNVAYYSYFDTVVSSFLIQNGILQPMQSESLGLVAETSCQYFVPISFPETVTVGLCVDMIGNSSVRYLLGIFREQQETPAAQGHFVQVYVDRHTRRPAPLSDLQRLVLESARVLPLEQQVTP